MANVYAVKSGNWSDTTVWNTGALPTSADNVRSNGFTVTIDQDVSVFSIRNDAQTPAVAGGGYVINGSFTVSADNLVKSTGTLLTCDSTGTINLNVNINNANQTGTNILILNIGDVNIVGNILNFNADGPRYAITKSGTGKLTLTGDILVNYILNNYVIQINAGDFEMTGNITLTTSLTGLSGFVSNVIRYSANTQFTVIGNITNYANRENGSQRTNCVLSLGQGKITHIGIQDSLLALGGFCIEANNSLSINLFSGPFISSRDGIVPFQVVRMHLIRTLGTYFEFRDETTNGAVPPATPAPATRLVSPDTAVDAPIPANVRHGVSYALGTFIGTLKVPSPDSVAAGVPTDNTVGNAVLTADAVWNYATANLTDANSIGARLKNVSTVDTTGEQLEALL